MSKRLFSPQDVLLIKESWKYDVERKDDEAEEEKSYDINTLRREDPSEGLESPHSATVLFNNYVHERLVEKDPHMGELFRTTQLQTIAIGSIMRTAVTHLDDLPRIDDFLDNLGRKYYRVLDIPKEFFEAVAVAMVDVLERVHVEYDVVRLWIMLYSYVAGRMYSVRLREPVISEEQMNTLSGSYIYDSDPVTRFRYKAPVLADSKLQTASTYSTTSSSESQLTASSTKASSSNPEEDSAELLKPPSTPRITFGMVTKPVTSRHSFIERGFGIREEKDEDKEEDEDKEDEVEEKKLQKKIKDKKKQKGVWWKFKDSFS